MTVRFKNGRNATEAELDAIARAFGFASHQELERACRDGDARRMDRRNARKAKL